MNILQMEDMVKGLPDDRLMQEARNPSGQMPQFLLVSEVQRRTKMRKDYAQEESVPSAVAAATASVAAGSWYVPAATVTTAPCKSYGFRGSCPYE
jgi:hypothetical protein